MNMIKHSTQFEQSRMARHMRKNAAEVGRAAGFNDEECRQIGNLAVRLIRNQIEYEKGKAKHD